MTGRDRASIRVQESMLEEALQYMRVTPLFKAKPNKVNGEYTKKTTDMVIALIKRFPELAGHRIAEALGINRRYVTRLKATLQPHFTRPTADEDEDEHRHQSNIKSTADELATLKAVYPGRFYQEDPRANFEDRAVTLVINNDSAHYKADQSHTIKRPITLPTKPIDIAA